MTAPWLTPLIEEIGRRKFVFHPPIANVLPNDWLLGGISGTAFRAINRVNGLEVSVPRQFVNTVTDGDGSLVVVGLFKELEFRDGAAWPRVRRVIEMPVPFSPLNSSRVERAGRASVTAIRLESRTNRPLGRLFLTLGAGSVVVSVLAAGVFRDWLPREKSPTHGVRQSALGLKKGDDYRTVINKLGFPLADHIERVSQHEQIRALTYPQLNVTVLLASQLNRPETYVGTVDADWRVLQWVGSEKVRDTLTRPPHQ